MYITTNVIDSSFIKSIWFIKVNLHVDIVQSCPNFFSYVLVILFRIKDENIENYIYIYRYLNFTDISDTLGDTLTQNIDR